MSDHDFATCQIGATSRWHVRSKSHIASISRITTGIVVVCVTILFFCWIFVGDGFFGSWGWLRLVFLAIYIYIHCILFVCVSSCSVLRGSEVWWWRCQASMSVNLLLEISDVPTPPMRRFPHHAVQWCLTAHVWRLQRNLDETWKPNGKLLWAWLEHQLWQLRGNHPMAIRAWWHLEDCKRSSNENSLIPAAATWLVMWLPFMIGLQGERYCQWMWDLLEKLSHAKGAKSSVWYLR